MVVYSFSSTHRWIYNGFFVTDNRLLQYIIRDFNGSTSQIADDVSAMGEANSLDKEQPIGSIRNSLLAIPGGDSPRSNSGDGIPSLEVTESTHYDTLHEMGIFIPSGRRKKSSLFDYGMKSD